MGNCNNPHISNELRNNLSRAEKQVLHILQGKVDLRGLPVEKGNAMILNTAGYTEKVMALLDDSVY
jgi:hypothetical protein